MKKKKNLTPDSVGSAVDEQIDIETVSEEYPEELSSDEGVTLTEEQIKAYKELTTQTKKLTRSERQVRSIQYFFIHAVVFVLFVYILFYWVVGFTSMPNSDMYPRLDPGDLLLYYRLDKDYKVQDIVVYEQDGHRFVSRVIAVEGDTVEITDSESVMVNGHTLIENNIFQSTPRYVGDAFPEYPLKVPEGTVFVLADARNGGVDSRYYGPIPEKDIMGKVITVMRRNNL